MRRRSIICECGAKTKLPTHEAPKPGTADPWAFASFTVACAGCGSPKVYLAQVAVGRQTERPE